MRDLAAVFIVGALAAGCAMPGAGRHLFAIPTRVVCEGAHLTPCGLAIVGCKGNRVTWECIQKATYLGPTDSAPVPADYAPEPK